LIFYLKRGRGVKKSSGQQSRNVKGRGAIRPRGCLGQDGDAAECQHCLRSHVPAVDHLLPLPLTSLPLPACDLEAPASPPLHHCPCALRDASTILFGMSRQGPRFCARVAPHHGTESAHPPEVRKNYGDNNDTRDDEMQSSKRKYSKEVDIWAFGVVRKDYIFPIFSSPFCKYNISVSLKSPASIS